MNPTTARAPPGLPHRLPGLPALEPGQRDPLRRPAEAAAVLPGLQLGQGQARPALRRLLHAHERTTARSARTRTRSRRSNTTSAALPSLDNFVRGQLRRFQGADQPAAATRAAPTRPRSASRASPSNNRYNEFALYANDTWSVTDRLKMNLGLRYEYFGPQQKSEPKYDSNFYYGDAGCSVNTSSITQILDCIRGGQVLPSNESPIGGLWASDWNNFAPRVGFAWDVTGDGKTSAPRRLRHGLRAQLRQRDLQRALQPAGVPGRPRSTRRPTSPSMPIYTDNQGPFGGVAGVTKPIPAGSLRHVDQNIETAYAHFYSLSLQREIFANTVASIEYTGSTGRKLYDLADPNKRGRRRSSTRAIGTACQRPDHPVRRLQHPRQPRPVAVPRRDLRPRVAQARRTRACSSPRSTPSPGQGQPQLDLLATRQRTSTSATSTRSTRCSTTATPSSTSATACSSAGIWELPLVPQLRGRHQDDPRRLAAQLDLHRPQRAPVHARATARTASASACAPRTRPASARTRRAARPPDNPNEFTPARPDADRRPAAGGYVNPITGQLGLRPVPGRHDRAQRLPRPRRLELRPEPVQALPLRRPLRPAAPLRGVQRVQPREHVRERGDADIAATITVQGLHAEITRRIGDGNRRIQIGAKFEF